ncbi:MAG: alanine--tRNA ligase [Verrucomicrobia bacterium CG_4_9_14_3_um_filter_43_20]|nr:MAG: alanine--tRNA ligase [Verrucomicrobia bacterium CG1_02_43_26]PIP58756.1 MAG: alanine--tRNA ligase [Verrucomicrobia bacterium CG22_combo_CG10-13_8_21_14_all_43_17]PIY61533.1 MAG: alanine--tRNA ligase [Verrucomicrobia bacterium CG_4_10_14_0_8_um_filter_43_34]PJA44399.1 MAG: alanine--tRNA ligase [Verrucomicrobia bacterium CG_4_9_14_3_um_filter_43_20]
MTHLIKTASDVRQSFLDFFKGKHHVLVESESLMPSSPNLLFTNSGMNQFVPYFLGDRPAPFPSAADTQKCIRAGGKHNDLEDVGFDTYHQTFFEMLGNWSFGDYFKKEAIEWAWELLVQVWGFPKERLYATVYKPEKGDPSDFDQEAYDIWKAIFEKEGMNPDIHIVYGNKKDNFWMMGDTGPCGPCSEVHMDLTPKGDSKGKLVNRDSGRCIEIWNLVFIQFNAEPNGAFSKLKARHVDTGMGLERVAGILATTNNFTDYSKEPSNYNSDLFIDLFAHLEEMSDHKYQRTVPTDRDKMSEIEILDCAFRVIADHIRTLTFAIADGIIPGNEGRNYVLRRILRRAVMFGKRLDLPHGFFSTLVDPLIAKMGSVFPELIANYKMVKQIIEAEEKTFDRTLDRGLLLFDKIAQSSHAIISGEEAFILYDTYGFPLDLTQLMAKERGLTVDVEAFDKAMEAQRTRARAAQQKTTITVSDDDTSVHTTQFIGYDYDQLSNVETTITGIVESEGNTFLLFEQTPFYAEMGGQVGDTGIVEIKGHKIYVLDTIKDDAGRTLHKVNIKPSEIKVGIPICVSVDMERRSDIQRHHTVTHLIHWALHQVLGNHVRQAGSYVDDKRSRFDFSHFEAISNEQLARIEMLVNMKILENSNVSTFETPFDKKPDNCIAFFGEKYGAIVRVVDISGYSVELCGGTHVRSTGEIGMCKIISESGIAAGTRRIEAITGKHGYAQITHTYSSMQHLAQTFACKQEEVEHKCKELIEQKKSLEKQIRAYQQKFAASQVEALVQDAKEIEGHKWVIGEVEIPNPEDMRGVSIQVLQKTHARGVILGGIFGDKVTILAICTPEAIQAGYRAGDIVRDLTAQLGGKGGGKPEFAMGGAKDVNGLSSVLANYMPHTYAEAKNA